MGSVVLVVMVAATPTAGASGENGNTASAGDVLSLASCANGAVSIVTAQAQEGDREVLERPEEPYCAQEWDAAEP